MSRSSRLRLAFGGMHPDRVRGLVERHGSARGVVARIDAGALDVSARIRDAVRVPADDRRAQLAALGHEVWFRDEPGYPERLAVFPDAPDVLFTRGAWPGGGVVGVVGTRRCTSYGRRLAEQYGEAIGAAGWVLASGLARGIDGAAHRGTVNLAATGVAVLGCGLDVDYPREHKWLADALVDGGGAIVSEYPPGTPPEGWRFPPRNRIISGLVPALLMAEGGNRSGALITVDYALAQGRTVYALEHPFLSNNTGGEQILSEGALDFAEVIAAKIERAVAAEGLFGRLSDPYTYYLGDGYWVSFGEA